MDVYGRFPGLRGIPLTAPGGSDTVTLVKSLVWGRPVPGARFIPPVAFHRPSSVPQAQLNAEIGSTGAGRRIVPPFSPRLFAAGIGGGGSSRTFSSPVEVLEETPDFQRLDDFARGLVRKLIGDLWLRYIGFLRDHGYPDNLPPEYRWDEIGMDRDLAREVLVDLGERQHDLPTPRDLGNMHFELRMRMGVDPGKLPIWRNAVEVLAHDPVFRTVVGPPGAGGPKRQAIGKFLSFVVELVWRSYRADLSPEKDPSGPIPIPVWEGRDLDRRAAEEVCAALGDPSHRDALSLTRLFKAIKKTFPLPSVRALADLHHRLRSKVSRLEVEAELATVHHPEPAVVHQTAEAGALRSDLGRLEANVLRTLTPLEGRRLPLSLRHLLRDFRAVRSGIAEAASPPALTALFLQATGYLVGIEGGSFSEIPRRSEGSFPDDPAKAEALRFLRRIRNWRGRPFTGIRPDPGKTGIAGLFLQGMREVLQEREITGGVETVAKIYAKWEGGKKSSPEIDREAHLQMGRSVAVILLDLMEMGHRGGLGRSYIEKLVHRRDIPAYIALHGWLLGTGTRLLSQPETLETGEILVSNSRVILGHSFSANEPGYPEEVLRWLPGARRRLDQAVKGDHPDPVVRAGLTEEVREILGRQRSGIFYRAIAQGWWNYPDEVLKHLPGVIAVIDQAIEGNHPEAGVRKLLTETVRVFFQQNREKIIAGILYLGRLDAPIAAGLALFGDRRRVAGS